MKGRVDAIEHLLKRGAKVNEADERHRTALHVAAQAGHPKTAEALLTGKAVVDPQVIGWSSPLYLAVGQGHCETVALPLRHKADPAAEAVIGGTMLEMARASGDEEMIKLLRAAGKKE